MIALTQKKINEKIYQRQKETRQENLYTGKSSLESISKTNRIWVIYEKYVLHFSTNNFSRGSHCMRSYVLVQSTSFVDYFQMFFSFAFRHINNFCETLNILFSGFRELKLYIHTHIQHLNILIMTNLLFYAFGCKFFPSLVPLCNCIRRGVGGPVKRLCACSMAFYIFRKALKRECEQKGNGENSNKWQPKNHWLKWESKCDIV